MLSHHGRQAWVLEGTGARHLCVFKGRGLTPFANDQVMVDLSSSPAVITDILPRRNQLIRSEVRRSKGLAANIDQAVVVVSGSPPFSDELLARIMSACAAADIAGIVALNKTDLVTATQQAEHQLDAFRAAFNDLGWQLMPVCAQPGHPIGIDLLKTALTGKTSVFIGQSGMGKSSLLNALIPGINLQTREISQALNTGKHTTTAGQMLFLDQHQSAVIDTPGFQLYGLHHLSAHEIALGFPEWQRAQEAYGRCRYFNCRHLEEPGCSVQAAVAKGDYSARRLALWRTILQNSVD